MASTSITMDVRNRQWFIVGRWQEYHGEARANLLRVICVVAFYAVELANYHGLSLGPLQLEPVVELNEHVTHTALAAGWVLLALGTLTCLSQRILPSLLKYVTTGADLVLLTTVVCVANGPRSPLIVIYFLLPILAALRFSLRLVWFATGGAMLGYLTVLGYARWFADVDLTVPRYYQVTFLLAIAAAGVIIGQCIRQVRKMSEEFFERLQNVDLAAEQKPIAPVNRGARE